ncbi:MAG: hypothetical protein IIX93_11690 [Clostridia bacterium]|nr:hypothetical protein [Clostridia bacterium]MBQ2434156.1 hypothetical protein [Clostridia bacterium]
MKKIVSCILALACLFSLASAEVSPEGINVLVSITDDQNNVVLAAEPVFVTDQDGDNVYTIADALVCAHAQNHENGAEAFAFEQTAYGLSMTMLWGIDNGGSYGYMVNDQNPLSLSDAVCPDDHIKAYCYTDLVTWSDTYSFFTFPRAEIECGETMPITLFSAGYDSSWNPVTFIVSNAVIIVNGEETEYRTDENGLFFISFEEAGKYILTAKAEGENLVAPVCVIDVR